jgi:5-(carboxyamino)imidazole ribonucleotide mutase
MGSDSDLPIMEKAVEVLKEFDISYHMTVASAHRTPDRVHRLVTECEENGTQVFIAGAGGAAHLAGVVASLTTRPVIGVPLKSALNGLDSLLSTVQMPKGIPVATVAIDNAANAAMLAVEIIATSDKALAKELKDKRKKMAEEVEAKGRLVEAK